MPAAEDETAEGPCRRSSPAPARRTHADAARFLGTTLRSLARQPGVALPAVLILALGIGLTTALFSYWSSLFHPRFQAQNVLGGDPEVVGRQVPLATRTSP